MIELPVRRVHGDAVLPARAYAGDAGIDLAAFQAVQAWLDRVEAQPGFVDDLVPYPANARAGASRSIYD